MARQRSSCPPPSPNLVRTHLIENHQALRDSAPCLSRAATLPKATKLELGRGAHLKTPSSANHTAAASQPTGRIAKAASWLYLSRVSPALLPPERPSHTHTPKPGFGGRGHEIEIWPFRQILSCSNLPTSSVELIWPITELYFRQILSTDFMKRFCQDVKAVVNTVGGLLASRRVFCWLFLFLFDRFRLNHLNKHANKKKSRDDCCSVSVTYKTVVNTL